MDLILLAVIVLAAFIGIIEAVKHFTHRGGCCGGGGYRMNRKKLRSVAFTRDFRVEGMKCKNCASRVEETVGDIDGVAGRVDLEKSLLTVSYEHEVDDELIVARIERLGYKVERL